MRKKNYVITGATSGIGKAIAQILDSDDNNLILLGRSLNKLEIVAENLKASTILIECDLTDSESVQSIATKMPEKIDGFIHAAGQDSLESIRKLTYHKFDKLMRLHVYSFVEILKIIEKTKTKHDSNWTSVVAISSVASDIGGIGQTIYSASKSALEACIRVLSKELIRKKIRLNTVKPGLVNTPMLMSWAKQMEIANLEELQLYGIAEASDIANVVKFLLQSESMHIIGKEIKVDSGGLVNKYF